MFKRNHLVGLMSLMVVLIQPLSVFAQEEQKEVSKSPVLPELPAPSKNFTSFYTTPQLDFAIDLESIAVQPGEENEIRYILKATSKHGAVNVSYEGIRCGTHQKIIYAIGLADGKWQRTRSPEWSTIPKAGNHLQQTYLAHDYFCNGNTLAGSAESMRNRIKWNKPLNAYGN